jgi:hypothetical protein
LHISPLFRASLVLEGSKKSKKDALQEKLAASRDRGASERQYFPCTLNDAKKYSLPNNVVVAIHPRGLDIVERKKKVG